MTECERIRELLPWYATGKIAASDAAAVSAHLQSCAACRQELAEVVWVRHTVGKETSDRPTVRQRVWRNIAAQAGFGNVANIDVGSLLVGFRLGVNARRAGSPVRASLRVMGHNVRVVGRERKATCNDPSNHE